MNQLTIQDADDVTILSLQIPDVDPALATVAILTALAALPKPRKERKDRGTKRKEATT